MYVVFQKNFEFLNLYPESTANAFSKVDIHNFWKLHARTDRLDDGNNDFDAKSFEKMTLHKNFVVHN